MTRCKRSGGRRRCKVGGCPGWPPGFLPEGCLTTGLGVWGGLAEGGREELEALFWSCSSRTRPRSVSVASCCCKRAMIASRCRHPGQEGSSIYGFYEPKRQAAASRGKTG